MKTTRPRASRAIYQPRGAALEYAPLAVNLYRGCGHACRYCYAPACLRMSREAFREPTARPGILEALERDLAREKTPGPILFCFTCDPYQPLEKDEKLMPRAIALCNAARRPFRILTKSSLVRRDLDLIAEAGEAAAVGVTLTFVEETDRRTWEPGASSYAERFTLLQEARARGIRTWVSLEPVIIPADTLTIIDELRAQGIVDEWKIGKWNHDPAAQIIDWREFLRECRRLLRDEPNVYYKKALIDAAQNGGKNHA